MRLFAAVLFAATLGSLGVCRRDRCSILSVSAATGSAIDELSSFGCSFCSRRSLDLIGWLFSLRLIPSCPTATPAE